MNSRSLLNIFLLLMLAVMAVFFYQKNNQPEHIQRLTNLSFDEIDSIRIPRPEQDIVLEKMQGTGDKPLWFMISPYQIKAHQFRVNTLLSLSQSPITKTYPISTLKLADYALDTPRAEIIFNQTRVALGKTNNINNKRYFKTDSFMTLIEDKTYPLISAQVTSLVDLHLLPDDFAFKTVVTPILTLTQQFEGPNKIEHWKNNQQLSADQVQTFFAHWKSAQAFAVHPYLEQTAQQEIVIEGQQQSIRFLIKSNDDWLILARPDIGLEYHLDKNLKDKLFGNIRGEINDA